MDADKNRIGEAIGDGLDHGEDSTDLLVGGNGLGTGTGGFAADVEDGCALVGHLSGVSDGGTLFDSPTTPFCAMRSMFGMRAA